MSNNSQLNQMLIDRQINGTTINNYPKCLKKMNQIMYARSTSYQQCDYYPIDLKMPPNEIRCLKEGACNKLKCESALKTNP